MEPSTLGERLKHALKVRNVKSQEVADFIGSNRSAVSLWISGRNKSIRNDYLLKICDYLKISPDWLVSGEGEMDLPDTKESIENNGNYIKIPEYSISFSAGNGVEPTFEELEDVHAAYYPIDFFRRYNACSKNCKRFRVSGDSMEPLINDGDVILVDCSPVESIKDNEIYAISIDGALRVKQLVKPLKGGLIVRSFNQAEYKDEIFNPEEAERVKIIGRVVDRYGIFLKPIR